MINDSIQDGIIAGATTGAIHSVSAPQDTTTSIILALISGVIAPLVKSLIEKWSAKRKAKKHENSNQ
jgi:hypothetical protein